MACDTLDTIIALPLLYPGCVGPLSPHNVTCDSLLQETDAEHAWPRQDAPNAVACRCCRPRSLRRHAE